jgi:hypothetical protein
MPSWEDLSPAVKRYAIVAAVLLAAILAFRSCTRSEPAPSGKSTRGLQGG